MSDESPLDSLSNSNEGDLSTLAIPSTPQVSQLPSITGIQDELNPAVEELSVEEHEADDDFGDFGHFASTAVEMFPMTDEKDTRYSRFSALVGNNDVKNGINVIWPVLKELDSRTDTNAGLIKDKNNIVPLVNNGDWVDLYHTLVSDTVFSENGGSRLAWRRSMIRQKFLQSLNITESKTNVNVPQLSKTSDIVLDKTHVKDSSAIDIKKPLFNTQNNSLSDREKDLIEAKKLCDFSEEEIRKKTVQELQSLVLSLQIYQQKMYEQSNYWLDAKEQLIMDAETHNKVIASLVQHARDQQQAPKVAKTTTTTVKRK